MPENVTPERTELLRMYGAEIVYSEGAKGSNGAVEMALEMAEATPRTTCPTSTATRPTRDAHYNGTALEILEELDEVAAFVAGLGTGGTLMGNGRRLKEELGDDVKIVAAEPMQGEPVQGLRSLDDGFIPPIIDLVAARPQDLRHQPRRDRLDAQAARRGGRCSPASPRARSRASRCGSPASSTRATSSSSSRRRLEVPLLGHLHAPGRRDRESGLHRLVVSDDGRRRARRALLRGAGAALAGAGGAGARRRAASSQNGRASRRPSRSRQPVERGGRRDPQRGCSTSSVARVAAYTAGIPLLPRARGQDGQAVPGRGAPAHRRAARR